MANSLLPSDHEVRVLVTVKNGRVTSERVLAQREIIASMDSFVELALKSGIFRDLANAAKE
ncbi:hypothetical protein [Buttiauxella brennerae]|uniref:hypothetical protein n=1 Tax=Buttiauxella brennerae TaxID=82988 RepID=UPI00286F9FDB|nr:hypothetical protein [Buttiauxella brennerae]